MIDLDKLPKIDVKDDDFPLVFFGLLPVLIGIVFLFVLMLVSEI